VVAAIFDLVQLVEGDLVTDGVQVSFLVVLELKFEF